MKWCSFPLAGALLLPLAPSQAATDPGAVQGLHWRCWYNRDIHITCLVDTVPDQAAEFSQSPRLPAIVQELRQNPEAFRNRFVQIPLYTQPYDFEFTARLARVTVCGSRPDCTVDFSASPPSPGEMDALLKRNEPAREPAE